LTFLIRATAKRHFLEWSIDLPHPYAAGSQGRYRSAPHLWPGTPERPKTIMLPHTRPGGMAGLLEILADQGGRVDLHRLADELSLEVDALLPTVDTAVLLGFLRVEEGDAVITPEGQRLLRRTFKPVKRFSARPLSPMCRCFARWSKRSKLNPTALSRGFSATPRRTFQRGRIPPPARNRHPVGPLRRNFRLRRRHRQADAH